ncbi:hypothetical protein Q3G72_030850 [Acer saccharum]|nr:hypothetical protein Q3G72_030850 [Acer saccharum]
MYLLVRAEDTHSAVQRFLNEVAEKELFRVLREKWGGNLHSFISEKVAVVPGDVSEDNLGVRDSNLWEQMLTQTNVILNFAATTNLNERYDVALETNTMGALRVLGFAKKCVNINMILHVSTEKKLEEEKLNQLRQENANEEAVTSIMKDLGIERARLHGLPNTYVFSKAMGEMLLCCNKYNLPLVIIRPTMILSTYKEPFPGWIEGLRTIDSVIIGYGKGKLECLPVNPDAIFDLIPADMVVDTMLMVMVVNANQICSADSILIYHVSSSMRNPIKFSNLHKFSYCYFTKNPYIDRNGKAVQISKGTVLTSWAKFQRYMAIRYLLPLKGLKLMNSVFCLRYKNICINSDRKIKFVLQLAELYKPYLFFNSTFDDSNTEKLRMKIRESGLEKDAIIGFDPKCINWEDYIINIHIPGLVKYTVNY